MVSSRPALLPLNLFALIEDLHGTFRESILGLLVQLDSQIHYVRRNAAFVLARLAKCREW